MNPVDMLAQVLGDVTGHRWMPLAVLLSGWLVMLLRRDSRFPVSIPDRWSSNRWKPVVVLLASAAYGGLALMLDPAVHWQDALVLSVRSAVFTLGLYAVVIKAAFGDKVPAWLQRLALIFPPSTPAQEAKALRDPDVPPTTLRK
jgi:hypothetical protein